MSVENSFIPKTVNPDLEKERKKAKFDVEEFTIWYNGGSQELKLKREIEHHLFKDVSGDKTAFHYKSHDEIYDQAIKDAVELFKKMRNLQEERNPGGNDIWPGLKTNHYTWGSIPCGNPFGVQLMMVVNAVKAQGTDEQWQMFGKRLANFEICATYAQTELGHGTFLRGLETRADFDRETDEFILNMPTLSAYKWWPGGLGHSSNYCILVARLFIDNESKGVQMFFVQLRDEETHMPLPGVDVGDIGKKIGFYGVNNGYLGLKNVRIPRTNMLMRNNQVHRDGTFVSSPISALTYYTMVHTRCHIVSDFARMLAMGCTIATRYSAVRRQSPINPNEPEPQIIDHVTQQLKLFPEIANSMAYHICTNYLFKIYCQTTAEIERGEFLRLPELHSLSCVLKVLCTTDAAAGIERLRLSCGGHGYLISSNMGPLYFAATAACTYEGENTVLLLQVGRFLMKTWRNVLKGNDAIAPTVSYLANWANKRDFETWTGSWENIVKALQFVATNKTRLACEHLSERLKSGQTEGEATNNTGIELIQAAELHGRSFIATTFWAQIVGDNFKEHSATLKEILSDLLELYLVNTTLRHMSDILRFIKLNENDLHSLQMRLEKALAKVRPEAVAICDGFDFHDRTLGSTLGSYDGNVYERIFEAAKNSPLNKQPVPKSFYEVLQPFMKSNI